MAFLAHFRVKPEHQLLERVKRIYADTSASPMARIEAIRPAIHQSKTEGWGDVNLQASILHVELLIDLEDLGAIEEHLERLQGIPRADIGKAGQIRLELAELYIADTKGIFEGMPERHRNLLADADQLDDKKLAGHAFLAVGRSQYRMADFSGAIKTLGRAYEAYESIEDGVALADVLSTLGNISLELEDSSTAIGYFTKALAVARKNNDQFDIAILLFNISKCQSNSHNYAQAETSMTEALSISAELNDALGVAWAKRGIGDIHFACERWRSAINVYREVEPTFVGGDNVLAQVQFLTNQASAHLALGEIGAAAEKAERAKSLIGHVNKAAHIAAVYQVMAEIRDAQGDLREAYSLLGSKIDLLDASHADARKSDIEQHRIRFDAEIMEKENHALAVENELSQVRLSQQAAQEKLWWMIACLTTSLLIVLGFLLHSQIRNRNHFKEISMTDALTSAPNRRSITEYLNARLLESKRTNQELLVGLADIDNFKDFNDSHGHQAGDEVLTAFADACQSCLRGYDRFGRYGGEEWLLVLPGADTNSAKRVFARIREALSAALQDTHSDLSAVTFSMGVALSKGSLDESPEALIRKADKKLYQAKNQGRNRVIC